MTDKFLPLTAELHGYLVDHCSPRDDVLRAIETQAEGLGDIAVMQIAPEQGAFLTLLARLTGARRAIELGTFLGYGTICLARGLAEGGTVISCELDPERARTAATNVEAGGVAERVDIRVGPGLPTLRAIPREPAFDLAFVDADKPGYPDYVEELLPRMRRGGLIALDNTLLSGRVLDPAADDESARALAGLNDRLAVDERVDCVALGLADGVTLLRVR